MLFFIADANDAIYVASYGLLKPLFLGPIDVTNGLAVFTALSLAGRATNLYSRPYQPPPSSNTFYHPHLHPLTTTTLGSLGDALGSVFRVFCEIIYKPIQAGTMTTLHGFKALAQNIYGSISNDPITR